MGDWVGQRTFAAMLHPLPRGSFVVLAEGVSVVSLEVSQQWDGPLTQSVVMLFVTAAVEARPYWWFPLAIQLFLAKGMFFMFTLVVCVLCSV